MPELKRKYIFLFGRISVVVFGVIWAIYWFSPDNNRAALVVTAQGTIYFYRLLGRSEAIFFGVVL